MTVKIMGPRVMVLEDEVIDEVTARAQKAGLTVVIDERNKPRPTRGRVVAVGTDPLIQEEVHVGDFVTYTEHAGSYNYTDGEKLRVLEHHEIITVETPDPPTGEPGSHSDE